MHITYFLVALIVLTYLTSNKPKSRPCIQDIEYFDSRVVAPVDNVREDTESLNDMRTKYARNPHVPVKTNVTSSRWMSGVSQPQTEDGHRVYTNSDTTTIPSQLQPVLKNLKNIKKNIGGYIQLGRASTIDGFNDDEHAEKYINYKTNYVAQPDKVAELNNHMRMLID